MDCKNDVRENQNLNGGDFADKTEFQTEGHNKADIQMQSKMESC